MSPDTESMSVCGCDPASLRELRAQRLLHREAELLDAWQFEEWLELMTEDLRYWAPVRTNRMWRERSRSISMPGESAHFDESLDQLRERVDRLATHMAWAEEPPSRTRHLVTNIRVEPTADPAEILCRSNFLVYRTRSERDMDQVVGTREDILREVGPGEFKIARRTVIFDMATILVKNLSLFY
ncbi:3-phenylpropionate/cinnamic acid dioxygenase subunit beta [Nocardioides sp. GXZ039]|uniref:3-phenylpropionate/cinnamic acid dioxygenase subunit beta n=1 Tax=Nocardioides sp. GXZ039 TaxID=3136018 RepID=UPI0030F47E59